MGTLIQPLFDGPVDIVGDIHGEIDALDDLLARLGYDRDGRNRKGRRLVFVGDLVDRGQDSPAVVERVAQMVVAGRAQCVVGNHELNLLLGNEREGNGWFRPLEDDHDIRQGKFRHAARATPAQRAYFMEWFATLPVGLERADLRVVHACWEDDHVAVLRQSAPGVVDAYMTHDQRIRRLLESEGQYESRDQELARWGSALHDPDAVVPLLRGLAAIDSLRQSAHPLRAMTSGLEQPAKQPFFASGKWRMTERVAWWDAYEAVPAVVMGHYWRWPGQAAEAAARARGPDLFGPAGPFDWLGPRKNVMCVDWCIGLRWRERRAQAPFSSRLGAVRWDSRDVVLTD